MEPSTMTLAKDYGIAAAIAIFVIKQLFEMLRQSKADNREDVKEVGKRLTDFETKFEAKLEALADKVVDITIQAEKLLHALKLAAQKDTDFHDRQLPAIERKLSRIDYEVSTLRTGLNEIRHEMGMSPIGRTPADGMPIHVGIPVAIDTGE